MGRKYFLGVMQLVQKGREVHGAEHLKIGTQQLAQVVVPKLPDPPQTYLQFLLTLPKVSEG